MFEKTKKHRIAAVVVTYNRVNLLKDCVNALRDQTRKLDEIIVVNNSSTDGTFEWLLEQNDLSVINQENSGSAGGQNRGIKLAYNKGYDLVWSLDCDIIPEKNALEILVNSNEIMFPNTGFLSSLVLDKNMEISFINIPYLPNEREFLMQYLKTGSFPIISGSFGSILFKREVISEVGFPNPKFFIWGDDVEYTFRIIKAGYAGYLVRESVAVHFQPLNKQNPFEDINILEKKFQYIVSNSTYCILARNKILNRKIIHGIYSLLKFLIYLIKSQRIKSPFKVIWMLKWWIKGICKWVW